MLQTAAFARLVIGAMLAAGFAQVAGAEDALKIAIGQRGGWEQCVSELGQNAGFFKKRGLALDVLYTQGSGATLQSVISASVDIGIGVGTHALLGAFAKGAPVRAIGSSFTTADDPFSYAVPDSPIPPLKDAARKTIPTPNTAAASNNSPHAAREHS